MSEKHTGSEKREFFRYRHEEPIHYNVLNASKDGGVVSKMMDAISKNLSASGILFATKNPPAIPSILVLNLDYRTTRICQEIEGRALILNDKLLGKVVRIEDNEDGLYNVGVAFVKKSDNLPKNIKDLVK